MNGDEERRWFRREIESHLSDEVFDYGSYGDGYQDALHDLWYALIARENEKSPASPPEG